MTAARRLLHSRGPVLLPRWAVMWLARLIRWVGHVAPRHVNGGGKLHGAVFVSQRPHGNTSSGGMSFAATSTRSMTCCPTRVRVPKRSREPKTSTGRELSDVHGEAGRRPYGASVPRASGRVAIFRGGEYMPGAERRAAVT